MAVALNCGACLEYGRERMSTRTSIPCLLNRTVNFSAEWLECPIVKTDPRLSADHLSPMANHPPSWRAFGYTASTAPILPQRVPGNLRTFRIIARPRSPQTFFRDSLHHCEEAPRPVLLFSLFSGCMAFVVGGAEPVV